MKTRRVAPSLLILEVIRRQLPHVQNHGGKDIVMYHGIRYLRTNVRVQRRVSEMMEGRPNFLVSRDCKDVDLYVP